MILFYLKCFRKLDHYKIKEIFYINVLTSGNCIIFFKDFANIPEMIIRSP